MVKVRVYVVYLDKIAKNTDEIEKVVGEEAKESERLKDENKKLLSLGGKFIRKALATGDKNVVVDEYGKPRCDGMFFNLSHSGELVGVAVCEQREVGFDLQRKIAESEKLVSACLNSDEKALLGKYGLTYLFSAKESLAKADGKGIGGNMRNIPALPFGGKKVFRSEEYYTRVFDFRGYCLCVAVKGEDFVVEAKELTNIPDLTVEPIDLKEII